MNVVWKQSSVFQWNPVNTNATATRSEVLVLPGCPCLGKSEN